MKSPAQGHLTILPLGEQCAHAQRACDFVRDQNSSQRGSGDGRCAMTPQFPGKLRAKLFRHARVLKNQSALDVTVAVQAGRKNKMPFKQRRMFAKDVEDLVFGHGVYVFAAAEAAAFSMSLTISCAAATGSGACVIGLPTTR